MLQAVNPGDRVVTCDSVGAVGSLLFNFHGAFAPKRPELRVVLIYWCFGLELVSDVVIPSYQRDRR